MDAALNTYAAAGIPADIAKQMAEPIARETLDNVFRLGTKQALTGPIARGDEHTVQRHQTALSAWDSGHAALYAALAQATRKLK